MNVQSTSARVNILAMLVFLAFFGATACQKPTSGSSAAPGSPSSAKGTTAGSTVKDSGQSTGTGSGTSPGGGAGGNSAPAKSQVTTGVGSGTTPGAALTMTAATFLTQLNGSWQQGCAKIAGSDNYTTLDMQLNAAQKTFTSQSQSFYDHNCQDPIYDLSIDNGNFTVDGPSSLINGAFGVNLSEDYALAQDFGDSPSDVYTTWQVINGQLFLGDMSEAGYDGATPLTRPRKLDLGRPLTRVSANTSAN